MNGSCFLLSLALLAGAAGSGVASAQVLELPGTRSYLGLNVARGAEPCAGTAFVCGRERSAFADRASSVYAGTMFGKYWGAEVGVVDTGKLWRSGFETRSQGLNLSLVGRAKVLPALGVFGKVGTTYGRGDTAVMGAGPDQGFGLSFGGGVSYDITPRLSATFELDSHDFRGLKDPVRSTNLGLQLRY